MAALNTNSVFGYYSALESFRTTCHASTFSNNPYVIDLTACAYLSNWIYRSITHVRYKTVECIKYVKGDNKYQSCQWAICVQKQLNTAFIVFKGTDPKFCQDIIADLSMNLSPIYPTIDVYDDMNMDDIQTELFAHCGMHAAIKCELIEIRKQLKQLRAHNINTLYITGHSLGGGLSIILGLELLIHKWCSGAMELRIVTFGAPNVIAIDHHKSVNQLSANSQQYWRKLHSSTHCIINKFDIVPRLLSNTKWIHFLTDFMYKELTLSNIGKAAINSTITGQIITGVTGAYIRDYREHGQVLLLEDAVLNPLKSLYKNTVCFWGPSANHSVRKKIELLKHDNEYNTDQKQRDSWRNTLDSIVDNASKTTTLYDTVGSFYFYTNAFESCSVSDIPQIIQQRLSYIAHKRLSSSRSIMMMLLNDHSMDEYLKLFGLMDCNDVFLVDGYMQSIQREITNGEQCGSGDTFWKTLATKESLIGVFQIQYRGLMSSSRYMQEIKKLWSHDTYKWRIIHSISGSQGYVVIIGSNNRNQIYDRFKRY